ncbi:MAG TPA: RnfABCDGE type electron transport complex subunit C, partial [Coriobacteriia bacterium]|nr:RnfABCDGE type electron transport complex subunit C [Coriobacteriia bacterium]
MPLRAFRGGLHPADRKAQTSARAIERAPVPPRLTVPLSQHLGAPCSSVVARDDRVRRGQLIGDTDAMIGAPVHAPVDGVVAAIEPVLLASGARSTAVVIVPDERQEFDRWEPLALVGGSTSDAVRSAGIVGLGGAAFPTTVKLATPHDVRIKTVIVNGCECEPYLTCDHRIMLEEPRRVVRGATLLGKAVGAERVVIAVEDNKPDAALALIAHAGDAVEVLSVPTRYPQGAERQLIWSVLGVEVPHGKLPSAVGALVNNVATAAAVSWAVDDRKPLIERVVTVAGNVRAPGNYLTLLGTPVSALIEAAGGISGPFRRIIAGGPMTG